MVAAVFCDNQKNVNRGSDRRVRSVLGDSKANAHPEQGQVLVILVLLLGVLIALVGLAVDGAVLYTKQGRLQAVADAAALAAAEALPDRDATSQTATEAAPGWDAARRAADLYVRLNGLSPEAKVRVVVAPADSPAASQVTVTLTQVIPLSFLPIVDVKTARVSASATAGRSSAVSDLVLALDSSRCNRRSGDWRCAEMREGAWALAQGVLAQGGRVGVVDYGRTARVVLSPTSEAKRVWHALNKWGSGAARTKERNLGDAIWLAARELAGLPGERPRGVLLLATGDATVGRNCCVECKCAPDGLAVCGRRCPYEQCCARWAEEMAAYAWRQGVFVMALDGTGTKEGTWLMRDIADLSDDGRLNGTEAYYILVGKQAGKRPRRGDFLTALTKAARQLPGGASVQLVR